MSVKYPVTIIIPSYCPTMESLQWLYECIESAAMQHCDIVVVDDGSPQQVDYYVESHHLTKLKNVKWAYMPNNNGPSYARNRCAERAETTLLFPLDCDDVLAPYAIARIYECWMEQPGTPVYPDIYKFGTEDVSHYRLRDWSCEAQYEILGIASVNVLHSKYQWEDIGGWDESMPASQLFEDAEYNARLFLKYCARNFHEPIVGYRQHGTQRTSNPHRATMVNGMLQKIGGYNIMGCCGGKRKTISNAPQSVTSSGAYANASDARRTELPGTQGDRVLALYIGGKGKGGHYYRGIASNFPYKVMHGELYYVDPRDAREESETDKRTQFIRVHKDDEKVIEQATPEQRIERTARNAPGTRQPVIEALVVDIHSMSQADILNSKWTSTEAAALLASEESGKNRVKVVKHLQRMIK